jgi:putative colanic acid biosynthesis UDP-glucose lipid carrier transferase
MTAGTSNSSDISSNALPMTEAGSDHALANNRVSGEWLSEQVIIDLVKFFDVTVVFLTTIAAKLLYLDLLGGNMDIEPSYVLVGFSGALLSYLTLSKNRVYQPDVLLAGKLKYEHVGRIFTALLYAFMLLTCAGFAFKVGELYSRGWYFTWFVLSFVSVAALRFALFYVLSRLAEGGKYFTRIAIYGVSPQSESLGNHIQSDAMKYTALAGIYDNEPGAAGCSRYAGNLDDLIRDGMRNRFDRIVIGLPADRTEQTMELLSDRKSVV